MPRFDIDIDDIMYGLSTSEMTEMLSLIIGELSNKDIERAFMNSNKDYPEWFEYKADKIAMVAKDLTDNVADESRIYNLLKDNL